MSPARALLLGSLAITGPADIWPRRTRATREEKRDPLAGDELVPEPMWEATRAVTIDAPPEDVWPWRVTVDGELTLTGRKVLARWLEQT
jgi:hypothetical protein